MIFRHALAIAIALTGLVASVADRRDPANSPRADISDVTPAASFASVSAASAVDASELADELDPTHDIVHFVPAPARAGLAFRIIHTAVPPRPPSLHPRRGS